MAVTKELNTIIKTKGISLTAISRATGISVSSLSKVFSGNRKLSASEFLKVCAFIEIDPNRFQDSA